MAPQHQRRRTLLAVSAPEEAEVVATLLELHSAPEEAEVAAVLLELHSAPGEAEVAAVLLLLHGGGLRGEAL